MATSWGDRWESFAIGANWTALHPLDMDRFYSFVIAAHQQRADLDEAGLKGLILERAPALGADEIRRIVGLYMSGRDLLAHLEKGDTPLGT